MGVKRLKFSETTLRLMQVPREVQELASLLSTKYTRMEVTQFHESDDEFKNFVAELERKRLVDIRNPDRFQLVAQALRYLIDARHA